MHRTLAIAALLLVTATAAALPVDVATARIAATHFLQQKGLIEKGDTLAFYSIDSNVDPATGATASFYVFNYGSQGFIIMGADDRCTPVLGYSMNGSFDNRRLPDNMRQWLNSYADEIQRGIKADAPANPDHLKLWEELLTDNGSELPQPKADEYLLTSTWEQGSGYNNYCPVSDGEHVVVGCVATAMAQIIRYYRFPARGFGQKSYQHSTYGVQAVNFDTTDYDYDLMPDKIRRTSSAAERDMVSRLCYHCGVVVNMNYQNPSHTSGSGAQTHDVPEGLLHFGYTDAVWYSRNAVNNDQQWTSLIRNEIHDRRPIEYSGFSNDGGHAFVLDGYNNRNQYHFNWGWGGYADGFYTLTTMVGFTSQHEMVINIHPSGWDGHLTIFHVSPDGNGDGTSWENSNSNIEAAVALNKIVNREIWMKEGTYYGNTENDYAFVFNNAATIYGGFAGTETSISQLRPEQHPTIIDGQNRHGLLYSRNNTIRRELTINNIILQNGYSSSANCISLSGDITTKYLTIRNCKSNSGTVMSLSSSDCVAVGTRIEDNQAPVICSMNDAVMRQSLLNNNNGNAVVLDGTARIANSDIVANHGIGVVFNHKRNSFVNNIVWGNDTCLRINTELNDTCLRHSAFDNDTAVGDSTCILLSSDNNASEGPRFNNPSATPGQRTEPDNADWHLARGSVCIDAGQRLAECITDGDLDKKLRCRNGRIDLGCYESNYPVAIDPAATADAFSLHPNPATTAVTVTLPAASAVVIYDMTGRAVLSRQAHSGSNTIDIASLPQGVYFVKSGTRTTKLIKK